MACHIMKATHSMISFDSNPLARRDPSLALWGSMTRSFFYQHGHEEEDHPTRWTYILPKDPSIMDYVLFPLRSFLAWMRLLCDNFDWRFILMIFCGQHLLKGLIAGGGSQGLLVVEGLIYMRLRVGASAKTVYQAIGSAAWGLKPLYALISDTVSINGYRRTPWIIITALMATCAYCTLVLNGPRVGGAVVCLCFFFAKLQLAWTDLMVEATYTEKMRYVPRFSTDIVSFAWSGMGLFALVGIFIAGPGIDYLGPIVILGLAIPFACIVIIPASAGFMTEKRLPLNQRGFQIERIREGWNYFLCTMILATGLLITMITGILHQGSSAQAEVSMAVCIITALSSVALLPPVVWKSLMYMFLSNVMTISTSGFVDNFYLDPATKEESLRMGYPMCKDCPHFSATFYYTVMGVGDSLFMIAGSFIFTKYMSHWSYRSALCVSQVIWICLSFLDIVQYQRWNLLMGLPDWAFMLGKSSVQNTVAMINAMPTTILMSKVCPRGMEASVFALLAGFSNFGDTIAGYLGAFALTLIGMDEIGKGAEDDFSNAWKACVIGVMFVPVSLLMLPMLIPAASMNDEISLDDEEERREKISLLTDDSDAYGWGYVP